MVEGLYINTSEVTKLLLHKWRFSKAWKGNGHTANEFRIGSLPVWNAYCRVHSILGSFLRKMSICKRQLIEEAQLNKQHKQWTLALKKK